MKNGKFLHLVFLGRVCLNEILLCKGIALLITTDLLDKNMIPSGLSHGHKQPEKTLQKTTKSRKHYSLAHPGLLLACKGYSEIQSVQGGCFCRSLGRKYQHTVLVSHFLRISGLWGCLEVF